MDDLFSIVENFFLKYNLHSAKRVAVAFSGGFDSMCLLDLTLQLSKKYGFELFALHLNHNWRGDESLAEAKNCENICKEKNIKFIVKTLPCDCSKTETAAREYRYNFFDECINELKLDAILTAHNANDNAETLIYRLTKGTGILGLQGIKEVRDKFYRPLININRQDIEQYCAENNLKPNSDSSNENTKYKRNFIRKEILPKLCQISDNAIDAINSLSKIAQNDNNIVEEYISQVMKKIQKEDYILTQKFVELSESVQNRIIYNVLIDNNLDYDYKTIRKLVDFINLNHKEKTAKKISLNNEKFLSVNDEKIVLYKRDIKKTTSIAIEQEGTFYFENYEFIIEKCTNIPKKFPQDNEYCAYCDLSKIQFPLTLRFRQEGDYIHPLGCKGSQKLKKFIYSKKIPDYKRDNIIMLAHEKEILWVAGLGISDKIKISNNITHKIQLKKIG